MLSTPAVWKQYNKMAVLHFFLVNFSLYILFSMVLINTKEEGTVPLIVLINPILKKGEHSL